MSKATSSKIFIRSTVQGTIWRYLTFFSGKLVLLISTAILARILTKEDFGLVGYAVTTINLLDILSDMGVGPALIYHSQDERTSSTAFWLNLAISLVLFSLAWFLAPFIADYFRDERAAGVIRILSLTYPISAIGTTHQKLIEKNLAFNRTFLPEFLRSLTKGITTIAFALLGIGAWSLVFGQLCGEIVSSIAYWLSLPWIPKAIVDRSKGLALLGYGLRYVWADSIAILLMNLDYLLVGRYLGAEALGVYTIAFRLPDLIILQFARTLSGVLFPVYSQIREIPEKLAQGFKLTTRYISLITVPMGVGLALIAKPFIEVVFSDKWVDAVPAVQGISIYAMFLSIAYNAGGAYKASGRPQIIGWLGVVRLGILFPSLWWAVNRAGTLLAVGWTHAFVALLSAILSLFFAAKILKIRINELYRAIYPAFLAGAIMTVAVWSILYMLSSVSPVVQLTFGIVIGGIVYLATLFAFFREVVVDAVRRLRIDLRQE